MVLPRWIFGRIMVRLAIIACSGLLALVLPATLSLPVYATSRLSSAFSIAAPACPAMQQASQSHSKDVKLGFCSPEYADKASGPYGAHIVLFGQGMTDNPDQWVLVKDTPINDAAALSACLNSSFSPCVPLPAPQTTLDQSSNRFFSWTWQGSPFPNTPGKYYLVAGFGRVGNADVVATDKSFTLLSSQAPCIMLDDQHGHSTQCSQQTQSLSVQASAHTVLTIRGTNWLLDTTSATPAPSAPTVTIRLTATCAIKTCVPKQLFDDSVALQDLEQGTFSSSVLLPDQSHGTYIISAADYIQAPPGGTLPAGTAADRALTFDAAAGNTLQLVIKPDISPLFVSDTLQLLQSNTFVLVALLPAVAGLVLFIVTLSENRAKAYGAIQASQTQAANRAETQTKVPPSRETQPKRLLPALLRRSARDKKDTKSTFSASGTPVQNIIGDTLAMGAHLPVVPFPPQSVTRIASLPHARRLDTMSQPALEQLTVDTLRRALDTNQFNALIDLVFSILITSFLDGRTLEDRLKAAYEVIASGNSPGDTYVVLHNACQDWEGAVVTVNKLCYDTKRIASSKGLQQFFSQCCLALVSSVLLLESLQMLVGSEVEQKTRDAVLLSQAHILYTRGFIYLNIATFGPAGSVEAWLAEAKICYQSAFNFYEQWPNLQGWSLLAMGDVIFALSQTPSFESLSAMQEAQLYYQQALELLAPDREALKRVQYVQEQIELTERQTRRRL